MIRTKLWLGCALVLTVSLVSASSVLAQEPVDQRTHFTFSAPFELPGGKTLPAGKYTFRIMDSPSNRHVVQIMSEDGKTMHATLLAIPAQRQDPPNDPEVRFMEAPANTPPAIRTWWYPGRTIGHEFIYPKEHARRLAARQKEPVLTVTGAQTSTEEMRTADLSRISQSGQETPAPTRTETTTARQSTPPPTTATTQTSPDRGRAAQTADASATRRVRTRTELPRTASALPLVGLIGLLSLAGAWGFRRYRRNR
jgi:hypothetical protein